MNPIVTAALINTGANLLGGFMHSGRGDGGAGYWNQIQYLLNRENMDFQQEMSRHGLRVRVEDAVSAGLHPLVGAGINPTPYSPTSAVFNQGDPSGSRFGHMGEAVSRMGQDVSRAMLARATEDERKTNEAHRIKLLAEADAATSQAELNRRTNLPPATPTPQDKYVGYRQPDGSIEWVYNPLYAMGLGADPIRMYRNSAGNIFQNPDAAALDLLQIRGSGSYGRSDPRRK